MIINEMIHFYILYGKALTAFNQSLLDHKSIDDEISRTMKSIVAWDYGFMKLIEIQSIGQQNTNFLLN